VVVPPQARASMPTREVISPIHPARSRRIAFSKRRCGSTRFDLGLRPVYAVRDRWQQSELRVEADAVTVTPPRSAARTFEAYVGKLVDRGFLLDAGVEAANMFNTQAWASPRPLSPKACGWRALRADRANHQDAAFGSRHDDRVAQSYGRRHRPAAASQTVSPTFSSRRDDPTKTVAAWRCWPTMLARRLLRLGCEVSPRA